MKITSSMLGRTTVLYASKVETRDKVTTSIFHSERRLFWENLFKKLKLNKCYLFSLNYVCMLKGSMTN